MAKKRHKEDTEFIVAATDAPCVPGRVIISLLLEFEWQGLLIALKPLVSHNGKVGKIDKTVARQVRYGAFH